MVYELRHLQAATESTAMAPNCPIGVCMNDGLLEEVPLLKKKYTVDEASYEFITHTVVLVY